MHAESLVRAGNQPQQSTNNEAESSMMMDLTRDGASFDTSFALECMLRSLD